MAPRRRDWAEPNGHLEPFQGQASAQLREFLDRRDRASLDHGWIDLTSSTPASVVFEPSDKLRACQQFTQ
jgi:hypothetical protein